MKVIVASGYFDPIHVGHIEYLEKSKSLGDKLIVIVNNDKQTCLKKGKPFMCQEDRVKIVQSLKCVDDAFLSIDSDATVSESIEKVFLMTENFQDKMVFANGGDRYQGEIPEAKICYEYRIEMVDGLGEKIRSSSELTKPNNHNDGCGYDD